MKPQHVKLLAYYHVAGGVLGCLLIISALLGNGYGTTELLVYCAAFLLFFFSVYCGYLGTTGRAHLFLRLAFAYQLIQVVMFSFDRVFTYKFFSGLALVVGAPLNDGLMMRFKFSLSTFLISWHQPIESFIGINLVALMLAFLLAAQLWGEKKSDQVQLSK